MLCGCIDKTKLARHRTANQSRNTDSLDLRTRHQRGLQAAHVDRDEVMRVGVHEPTDGNKREGSEALVKLAAGRLSLHSPTHSVLARIEDVEPLDSAQNPAWASPLGGGRVVNLIDNSGHAGSRRAPR